MKKNSKSRRKAVNPVLQEFGGRLRAARLAQGWTQVRVATALHLSVAYVSLLERGGRNPPYRLVCRLAHTLNAPTAALFG